MFAASNGLDPAVRMLGRFLVLAGPVGAAVLVIAFVGAFAAPAIGFCARLIDVALCNGSRVGLPASAAADVAPQLVRRRSRESITWRLAPL